MRDYANDRQYALGLRTAPGRLYLAAPPRIVGKGQWGWVFLLALVIVSEVGLLAWQVLR